MSAGATSSTPHAAAGSASSPATLQELVGAVAEQLQKAPPTDKAWKIAGFNVGNLWAIVLLGLAYFGPKLEAVHTRVMAAVDSLPKLQFAITELAETTRLTGELLKEMQTANRRLEDKVDRTLTQRPPETTP